MNSSGILNYMSEKSHNSLYKNGKVFTKRDINGSDAGSKGIDLNKKNIKILNARETSQKNKISIDKQIYLLNYNQTIYSNVISETVINNGNLVKLNILENTDSFSDSEWNEIYKMSEDTFVEENEELKKNAAGAGITDND